MHDPRAMEFYHAQPRTSLWLRAAVAVVVFAFALMIVAGIASAADWQMLTCNPGEPCTVRHIYFDNAGVACTTDAVGEKIVRPGVVVKCERLPKVNNATR